MKDAIFSGGFQRTFFMTVVISVLVVAEASKGT
jgi:hypothetical protein